jgi:hypothetical protein
MLLIMIGNTASSRRATTRWLRRVSVAVLSLATLLPAPAFAQTASDSGWFDPPSAGPADPAPHYDPPTVSEQAAPAPAAQPVVDDADPSALTTFRPVLDPYGSWVSDPKYGTVWVPHREAVGADFAPYVSRGHWALTADDDWIWVSDYPFGWAVFHYGRWVWIGAGGWAWVPGRTYANAWVVWRVPSAGYAYVGWAPMPPSWVWMNGYAVTLWYGPPVPYVFCPSAYVFNRHVHHHIVHDRHLVHRIANHTRVHPTPYRAPAQPTRHTAARPDVRTPAPAPSSVPRGPRLSAARVPAQAIPAQRTAPPASAARLAPRRIMSSASLAPERAPTREVRPRTPERIYSSEARRPVSEARGPVSEARRPVSEARPPVAAEPVRATEPVRRTVRTTQPAVAPAAPRARSTAAERMRAEPRSVAPARMRPPSTVRDSGPMRRTRRP